MQTVKRIILNIGEVVVSSGPAVMEAVLSASVAVCLWDDKLKIGGICHFMLPDAGEGKMAPTYYGSEAIRVLVDSLCREGSESCNLRAKIFGGGSLTRELSLGANVGGMNVMMARKKLQELDIPVIEECTGMPYGMRVTFYSATGDAVVVKAEKEGGSLHN